MQMLFTDQSPEAGKVRRTETFLGSIWDFARKTSPNLILNYQSQANLSRRTRCRMHLQKKEFAMKWAMLVWTAIFLGVMALSLSQHPHSSTNNERTSFCGTCDAGY
jgi:hypothetical protein